MAIRFTSTYYAHKVSDIVYCICNMPIKISNKGYKITYNGFEISYYDFTYILT